MKRLLLILVVLAVFFIFFLDGFAYYWFLSPESNTALEEWKNRPPESKFGYYYALVSDSNGTTSFLSPAPEEDINAVPTTLDIGEEWVGPSGRTYIVVLPASIETGAGQINAKLKSTLVLVKN